MMNTMRKNMKVILWIVVLAFVGTIFFVWGMDLGRRKEFTEQASAAVVNNEAISYEQFSQAWEQRSRQLFENNEEPDRKELDRYRQELISEMIDSALLQQESKKLGLKVHPDEVAARIMAVPAFQENGKFSQQKYLTLLSYNRIQPDVFEAEQKRSMALVKMTQLLHDSVVVTDEQVKQYFLGRSRKLKLLAVSFNWKDASAKIQVPEEEISDYYKRNRQQYDQPEEVKASHILVAIKPNAGDEEKLTARLKAENIRNEIEKKGKDFAEMAKQHSEDPGSKTQGGELGFFRKGMMVPAFEKAAFSMKVGELSKPVETNFGFHLIKLTDRKAAKPSTLAEVRGKIVDLLKEQKARKQTQKAALDFMLALKAAGSLEAAAKQANVKLIATDWSKEDGAVPGIANSESLVDSAFDLALHKPSGSLFAGDTVNYIEVTDEQYQPFNEELYRLEKDALTEKLKSQLGEQMVKDWLASARAKAKIVNNIAKEAGENQAQEQPAPQSQAPADQATAQK